MSIRRNRDREEMERALRNAGITIEQNYLGPTFNFGLVQPGTYNMNLQYAENMDWDHQSYAVTAAAPAFRFGESSGFPGPASGDRNLNTAFYAYEPPSVTTIMASPGRAPVPNITIHPANPPRITMRPGEIINNPVTFVQTSTTNSPASTRTSGIRSLSDSNLSRNGPSSPSFGAQNGPANLNRSSAGATAGTSANFISTSASSQGSSLPHPLTPYPVPSNGWRVSSQDSGEELAHIMNDEF